MLHVAIMAIWHASHSYIWSDRVHANRTYIIASYVATL